MNVGRFLGGGARGFGVSTTLNGFVGSLILNERLCILDAGDGAVLAGAAGGARAGVLRLGAT